MSCPLDTDSLCIQDTSAHTPEETSLIVQAPKASEGPSDLLRRDSEDLFFQHLFPSLPVFERHELNESRASLLVNYLLYFSGCIMKRFECGRALSLLKKIHTSIKTILFFDMEPNKLTVLKTLCVLGCWSPNSPDVVTLDSSWHWTGMAIRLALQMGLHRESTYKNSTTPDCRRRLWWCLVVSTVRYQNKRNENKTNTNPYRIPRLCKAQAMAARL